MKLPVTSGAERVPSANELFRRCSRVRIMAGRASPASHRSVDAAPGRKRVVARKAAPGILLELGKGGIMRGVAGRAFAVGHRFMKVPLVHSRGLPEILVARVACFLLILSPQFPIP